MAYNIIDTFRNPGVYSSNADFLITFTGNPYLYIPIGIFIIGAIIALAKRLIRG